MTLLQRWHQTALHNKVLVGSGLLVAFGTLFYAAAAAFQVWLMNRSSKEATRQTDRLITEANRVAATLENGVKQADTALRASATANEESLRANLRPYVTVTTVRIVDLAPGRKFEVPIEIINSGRTPAINLRMFAKLEIQTPPGKPNTIYDTKGASVGFLASQSPQAGPLAFGPDPLSQEMFNNINQGKLLILLHGLITYSDVFVQRDIREGKLPAGTMPHRTTFCYQYDHIRYKAMVVCRYYNNVE